MAIGFQPELKDLQVLSLGTPRLDSPLRMSMEPGDGLPDYKTDDRRIPLDVYLPRRDGSGEALSFECAGPRPRILFDPQCTRAAIVTCGGLCPGINNVIQSIFLELYHRYGVKRVLGVRYGYAGFDMASAQTPLELTPQRVDGVQHNGGSFLGSSRGAVDPALIVESCRRWKVNLLFAIGGDGTLKGAHAVAEEALRQGYELSVIGVPKTVDNDILFVYKTFGFDTAVQAARQVLLGAHNEAEGAPNGVGLVKLMGRDSGFIACHATLASMVVNFCLIPECPFSLEGPGGLFELLEDRLARRNHAVIVAAEGAGLDLVDSGEIIRDKSGNIAYSQMSKDVGIFMRDRIKAHFAARGREVNLKYIDPSYVVRSVPADAGDALFCNDLGRAAVHAAMAGKTDMVVGLWHNVMTHVPLSLVTRGKKKVALESSLWNSVLSATGQPARIGAAAG